jgi:glyoxylase-like metal-dependent hydrolase (beta-lactamase superfamily II)
MKSPDFSLLKPRTVARDVIHFPLMPRNAVNAFLIEDVLIDAGTKCSSSQLMRFLKGLELNAHALTHAHADHQGGSKVVCTNFKVPLWCSSLEKERAESGLATKDYVDQGHLVTQFQQRYWAGPGHQVDKTLEEGDLVGGFRVIATPGHSSGHLSFFRESDGVLIVGDVMTNMNLISTRPGLHEPPALFTEDRERNIQSIRKLAALKPRILCFGHGPVLCERGELKRFIEQFSA